MGPAACALSAIQGRGAYMARQGMVGVLAVDALVHLAGWAVSAVAKTERLYDGVGSLAFLCSAAVSLNDAGGIGKAAPLQLISTAMVTVR